MLRTTEGTRECVTVKLVLSGALERRLEVSGVDHQDEKDGPQFAGSRTVAGGQGCALLARGCELWQARRLVRSRLLVL